MRKAYTISDGESFAAARALLKSEGVLAGSSSGTLLAAALRYCREQTEPKRVVTFVCDSGNKYLSKMFDDRWMTEQGLLQRPVLGDLRDLISRLHDEGAVVTVGPEDTLHTAYTRMKLYDVSQVPVLDGQRCVGLLDEFGHPGRADGRHARFQSAGEARDDGQACHRAAGHAAGAAFAAVRPGPYRPRRRWRALPRPHHPHRSPQSPAQKDLLTMPERTRKDRPATLAVHAGVKPDPRTGAVMTPIYASATFAQSSPGVHTGWEYARTGNPTRAAFEAAIAELEGGVAGFAFASGLAAEATVLELLDQGSHITAADDLYGGSWRLFERVRERSAGFAVTYADPSDLARSRRPSDPRPA